MTAGEHKTAAVRKKELELAIIRIERGRCEEKKVSFSSVARVAGVTAALIHNHYPEIAEKIRFKQNKTSRQQRDSKHQELKATIEKNKELQQKLNQAELLIRRLISENEVLQLEVGLLTSALSDRKVVPLR